MSVMLLLLFFSIVSVIAAVLQCPDDWLRNGDECFLFNLQKSSTTWYQCESYCRSSDASMLCVESATKENYILSNIGTLPAVWISYNDIETDGDWQWAEGCPGTSYTNWDAANNEPNGANIENCVELYNPSSNSKTGWNDAQCDLQDILHRYCMCQKAAAAATPVDNDNDDKGNDNGGDSSSEDSGSATDNLSTILVAAFVGGFVFLFAVSILRYFWLNYGSAVVYASEDPHDDCPPFVPYNEQDTAGGFGGGFSTTPKYQNDPV